MQKRNYISKVFAAIVTIALVATVLLPEISRTSVTMVNAAEVTAPKYVFYFIGDGLGAAQRQAAEYYLQTQKGNDALKLTMNTFPVAGINTTHSADTLVTDSAAAGTALATGYKTNNGVISQLPDGTDVKTLVEAAEEKGMATGIITTTRLTHATPAVFASHNENRNNENEIAEDFITSGVDFIAGGGARNFLPQGWKDAMASMNSSKRTDGRNLINEFGTKGYNVFYGVEQTDKFRNYSPKGEEKVFAAFTSSHLPYEVDRMQDDSTPSLSEITQKGIDVLSKYDNGFFMMIEGGRIDHACHANDPAGSIHDTLAFDEAVKKAYDFYNKYPNETLIVVVGDHETGGMGLGFGNDYFLKMDGIDKVKLSVEDTLQKVYTGDRDAYFAYIAKNMGLSDLTEEEKATITKAMDLADKGESDSRSYGYYEPVAIATTHVVSERANMFWTTFAHSGTQIPMSAIGVGASQFGGFKDNTEIAKTMAQVVDLKLQ